VKRQQYYSFSCFTVLVVKSQPSFQKNLSQKYSSLSWGPGPGKVGPNVARTCPRCDVIPRKHQTENYKIFFQSQLQDLLNP